MKDESPVKGYSVSYPFQHRGTGFTWTGEADDERIAAQRADAALKGAWRTMSHGLKTVRFKDPEVMEGTIRPGLTRWQFSASVIERGLEVFKAAEGSGETDRARWAAIALAADPRADAGHFAKSTIRWQGRDFALNRPTGKFIGETFSVEVTTAPELARETADALLAIAFEEGVRLTKEKANVNWVSELARPSINKASATMAAAHASAHLLKREEGAAALRAHLESMGFIEIAKAHKRACPT